MQKKLLYALFSLPLLAIWACTGGDKTQAGSSSTPYAGPPYTVQLEEHVNPNLPSLHAYIQAVYQDKIVMMGGRQNGLHSMSYEFEDAYNDDIYVVNTNNWANPETWIVKKRNVDSIPWGNLNLEQLEANNAQFFTEDSVLYIVGGMLGKDVITNRNAARHCSPYMTAIALPALISLVNNGTPLPSGSIRQAKNDQLAVTGGELELMGDTIKLVFGWKVNDKEEAYTHEVRSFTYEDKKNNLTISQLPMSFCPTCWDKQPSTSDTGYYRRRDGTMSDMVDPANGKAFLLYYAGVFKNGKTAIPFDNPVWIGTNTAKEIDFSMRSNIYTCKVVPMYSPSRKQSYATLLGGMTNAIYKGAAPDKLPVLLDKSNTTDDLSAPFSNQISTLMIDAQHQFGLYLLPVTFPATKVDYKFGDSTLLAGSVTYNGTGSELFWTLTAKDGLLQNGVINYDDFIKAHPEGSKVGYLHGGILSMKESTFSTGQQGKLTRASNRIFAVKVVPLQQ